MAFFNVQQPDKVIIIVGLCVLAVGLLGAVVAIIRTLSKYKYTTKTERQKMEGSNTVVSADEYLEEILMDGDSLVLVRNVVYNVGQQGQIACGVYSLRSAIDGENKMQLLHNSNAISVDDGATITLDEGDTIACTSGSMLLDKQ